VKAILRVIIQPNVATNSLFIPFGLYFLPYLFSWEAQTLWIIRLEDTRHFISCVASMQASQEYCADKAQLKFGAIKFDCPCQYKVQRVCFSVQQNTTHYLVHICALVSVYQINTDKCTHILSNHHFCNTIHKSNMFQILNGHLHGLQLIHCSTVGSTKYVTSF